MSDSQYKIYTADELRDTIKYLMLHTKKIKDCGDATYDYLFEGLDIDLLILYCSQIKISTQYDQSDTGKTLRGYSEKILALVPLWRKITEIISQIIKKFETTVSVCDEDFPSDKLTEAFENLLAEINPLYGDFNALIDPINNQQGDLANFMMAKLDDAIKAAKEESCYTSFMSLLVNSKLTSGTYAAVKNLGIMFSLIINDLKNSVSDIKQCQKDPIGIYIDLKSNVEIFGVLKTVSDKINKSMEKFKMINSTVKSVNYDYAPSDNPEINALYQKVATVTDTVVKCKKEPTFGKTSFMMLKLMTGDTGVLSQIPTLSVPVKATSPDTYAVDFAANGDETLVSETSDDSIKKSAGLFGMSKDDVINILRYVKLGLQLPTTEATAATYLGYTGSDAFSADHPEFSPLSFASFYQPFNTHASLWNDLENGSSGIIAQSNDLGKYGSMFNTRVNLIVNMLSNLDVTKIDNVEVPSEKDKSKMDKLADALLDFQEKTNGYSANAQALRDRLLGFQTTLGNTLQPAAEVMKSKMDALDIAAETKALKAEIDDLNRQIKSKTDEYNKDVGLAFTGAAGFVLGPLGIISWAVTGGVYGDRAEKVRKERNKLQDQCDAKTKLYNNLNKVSGAVEAATSNLHNLGLAISNAVTGLNMLVAVWNSISTDIGNAAASLGQLNSKSEVFDFIFGLADAANAWGDVPDVTTQLLAMFKEARNVVSDQVLDTTAAAFILDTMSWNDNSAAIGEVAIDLSSKYMPVLKEKASDLKTDAKLVYEAYTDKLLTLRTSDLPNIDKEIEMYNRYKSKLDIYPDDETAKSNIESIVKRIENKNTAFTNSLTALSKSLKDNADILKQNTRKDLSALGFYTQLNNECKRFATVISDQTELMINNFITPMSVLMEEIKSLDGAIEKEVDPENMIANFKKFLPSSEEVSSMITAGASSPEQGAVEAAKALYKIGLNALEVFGKTIKLCSNIDKRSQLYDELAELRKQMKTCEKSLQEMFQNNRELKALINLEKPLEFFALNGEGLAEYLDEMNAKFQNYIKTENYDSYSFLLDSFSDLEQPTTEKSTILSPPVGYCIKTLPHIDSEFRAYSGIFGDSAAGGTVFSFEQGYGNLSKAGATVQIGVTGHVEIDLEITSLSEKFYTETTNDLQSTFTHETTSEMQRATENNDQQSWWFAFLAGGSSSHQTSSDISKQQNGEVTFTDSKVTNSATQNMEKNKQKFRVKGSFDIVGQSYIPTTVYLFIETLTIKTSDGQTILIPTQNVAAADANGNTGAGTPSGKLNITPIS
ncbi:MAG: alpha-xenorhabdolysin family binary toxin subunit A [Ruminococcus sp.]|jgi:hypothetical protein|nr:alpha-xenorhabdolysin family binary toxin subunit A [Ruminococcus sp.]